MRKHLTRLTKLVTFTAFGMLVGLGTAQGQNSAQDGNWSDGNTWVGGSVPPQGDFVRVQHNVAADVDVTRGADTEVQQDQTTQPALTINPGVTFSAPSHLVRMQWNGQLHIQGSLAAANLIFNNWDGVVHHSGPSFSITSNLTINSGRGRNTVRVDNSGGNVTSFSIGSIQDNASGLSSSNKNRWTWDGDDGNPIIPVDVTGDINKADRWDLTVNFNDLDPSDPTTLFTYGGDFNDTGGFALTVTGSSDSWVVDTSVAGEIQIRTVPPVEVPDVEGQSVTDATNALTAEGFTVNVERWTSDYVPVDQVIEQDPDGGEFAPSGSEVTIYVSDGLPTGLDWTGATDSQFDVGGNWVGVGDVQPEGEWPPSSDERLRIINGDVVSYAGANLTSINSGHLQVSNDSHLDITGGTITLLDWASFTVGMPFGAPGSVTMTGGTLDVTDGWAVRLGYSSGSMAASGEGTFIVGGNAIVRTRHVLFPHTATTADGTEIGGTGRLEIHGSNVTFDVNRTFIINNVGTASLAFVADADGFSTIEVSTWEWDPQDLILNGTLEIDFNGHQAALESGVETERVFTLITHDGAFTDDNDVLATTNATLPTGWTIANDTTENAVKLTFDATVANIGDWMRFE